MKHINCISNIIILLFTCILIDGFLKKYLKSIKSDYSIKLDLKEYLGYFACLKWNLIPEVVAVKFCRAWFVVG